jgi:hypothetical protein
MFLSHTCFSVNKHVPWPHMFISLACSSAKYVLSHTVTHVHQSRMSINHTCFSVTHFPQSLVHQSRMFFCYTQSHMFNSRTCPSVTHVYQSHLFFSHACFRSHNVFQSRMFSVMHVFQSHMFLSHRSSSFTNVLRSH